MNPALTRQQFERFGQKRTPDRYKLYRDIVTAIWNDAGVWKAISELPQTSEQERWLHYLFFGGVQYVVLSDDNELLGDYFRSSSRYRHNSDQSRLGPVFKEFIIRNWDQLRWLLAERKVQINKIGRIAAFVPLFLRYAKSLEQPCAYIEVGSATGLGLLWPYINVSFGDRGVIRSMHAKATLMSEVIGRDSCSLDGALPPPRFICGIERWPLSASNEEDCRWVRSLLGPDDDSGRGLLDFGLRLLRENQPDVRAGSVEKVLPRVLDELDTGIPVVVYHAMILQDLKEQGLASAFARILAEESARRVVRSVGIEWSESWDGLGVCPVDVVGSTWTKQGPQEDLRARADDGADGRTIEFR